MLVFWFQDVHTSFFSNKPKWLVNWTTETELLKAVPPWNYCLKARCSSSSSCRRKRIIKIGHVNYSTCLLGLKWPTSKTRSLLDNPIYSLNPRGSAWSTRSATPYLQVAELVDQALLQGIQLVIGLSSRDFGVVKPSAITSSQGGK